MSYHFNGMTDEEIYNYFINRDIERLEGLKKHTERCVDAHADLLNKIDESIGKIKSANKTLDNNFIKDYLSTIYQNYEFLKIYTRWIDEV